MKKLYIILAVLAMFVFVSPNAFAFLDLEDNSINNTATGGAGGTATATGGAGGDASVKNSGNSTNVIGNATTFFGDAKSFSPEANANVTNNNTNKQGQLQGQGQVQGQQQGQGQGQGQMNNWTQIYEDKRDHITGPAILQPDAKFTKGQAFSTKVHGVELLSNIDELTQAQAKKLASKASDVTCEPALIMENDFSTNKVKCSYGPAKAPGEFMGYLYMGSDGNDVNSAAMIGEAAVEAMKAGATHMRLVKFEAGEISDGSAWNIGLGGGASMMSGRGGDGMVIAPNGGLGYGKAKAFNELRPEMVFELTFDKTFVVVSKPVTQTGNHRVAKVETVKKVETKVAAKTVVIAEVVAFVPSTGNVVQN